MANCCRDLKIKIIMNINYELIAVLATCLFIIGCIVIHELRLEKKESNYKKYLDSFMVGDIFELKLVDELRENPFYDERESSKYRCVITDIKENLKGEKWVKFRNYNGGIEVTKEIQEFAERRKRIGNTNCK
jgi:hypothetical protein